MASVCQILLAKGLRMSTYAAHILTYMITNIIIISIT